MTERRTVTQIKAQEIINALAPLGMAVMMWGPPGIGKSAGIRQLAMTSVYTTPGNDRIAALNQFLLSDKDGKIIGDSVVGDLCAEDQRNILDVINQYGITRTGRPLYDIRLVQQSPIDLKGIPVYDTKHGEASWVMTGAFPIQPEDKRKLEHEFILLTTDLAKGVMNDPEAVRNGRRRLADVAQKLKRAVHDQFAVIFLDELSVAPAMVQAAALQLVLDRKSGMYEIPPNAFVVAAGNRLEDKVGASTLTPTMASRMVHLHLEPNLEDWMTLYAIPEQVHGLVIGYLNFQKQDFFQFDPKTMGRGGAGSPITFACPRTWDMLSRTLKACPMFLEKNSDDLLLTLAAGTIGDAQAYSFSAFIRIYHTLPSVDKVFTGEISKIDYKDYAPEFMPDGKTRLTDNLREQHALGLMFAFVTAVNSRIVEIYRDCKAKEASGSKDSMKPFEKAYKNYLNFILEPEYIEKTPEIAVISVTSLNEIPRVLRMSIDKRSDNMISRINVGGAYAQRAVQSRP